jgi:hypothetical protein
VPRSALHLGAGQVQRAHVRHNDQRPREVTPQHYDLLQSVFRIRDMLRRIQILNLLTGLRIRIWNRILLIRQWLSKTPSHKTNEIKGFPIFFACWWKLIKVITDPGPGGSNTSRSSGGTRDTNYNTVSHSVMIGV